MSKKFTTEPETIFSEEKEAAIAAWTRRQGVKTERGMPKRKSPKPQPKVRKSREMDEALEELGDMDVQSELTTEVIDWRAELAALEEAEEAEWAAQFDTDALIEPEPEWAAELMEELDEPCDECGNPKGHHLVGCPKSPESLRMFAEIDAEIEDRDEEMNQVIDMLRDTPEPYRSMLTNANHIPEWERLVELSHMETFVGGWSRRFFVSRAAYMRFKHWLNHPAHQNERREFLSADEPFAK